MINNRDGIGFLYQIVDCARMAFSSVRNRRSARTAFRPRKIATLQLRGRDLSRCIAARAGLFFLSMPAASFRGNIAA
jgi:hypothetical protein